MPERRKSRWRAGLLNLGLIAALLWAVSFLPPDTSLADRRKAGVLTACVPPTYPPLVTGDAAAPGFDVEVLGEIAARLGLRLMLNVTPSIGRDFNPRNWRLTRAQCVIVAGGVIDGPQTRAFLQAIPTGLSTGWTLIGPEGQAPGQGAVVGVLPGSGGLSRITLSNHLRALGARVVLMRTPQDLAQALASGKVGFGVAERLVAEAMDGPWALSPLGAGDLAPQDFAFALWKGDQTLKRAVVAQLQALARDGTLPRIGARYGVSAAGWAAP